MYHDEGNLNWALIVPRESHNKDLELAAIASALAELGYEVQPGPRGGLFCSSPGPWFGQKVTGTARRFGVANVLHHGTLLVDSDLSALQASLGGIDTVDDISLASVSAKPVNITSIGPPSEPKGVASGINRVLGGTTLNMLPSEYADTLLVGQEMDVLSSDEWMYRATPRFKIKIPAIEGDMLLAIEKGIVACDGLDPTMRMYEGRAFSFELYFELVDRARRESPTRGNNT